ncbi:MAG: amidohydrolase [Lachnospiraceae bacterium]|jgi:5-methylthioadenosine/S-adenosylhomocysteine deaminase|nr:amidohydrolase [Lachnospiraceae bacterium]
MKTLITNGIIVTMNPARDWYPNGYVMFEGSKILKTGPMDELGKPQEDCLIKDACRGIVMPGMVNTHSHIGMVPFRGLGDDCKDRLRVFLLPMEQQAMDKRMAKASSLFAICELLLGGVTTVLDMYYFEEQAAAAMDELGIRGIAAQTVIDQGACDVTSPREAIARGEALMKQYQDHPRISACLAPHGTTTCSPDMLKLAYQLDRDYQVPFTLHAAEMDYEIKELREQYNCTPVEFLDQIGVLGPETIAAHCIHLTAEDRLLLKERGSKVSHCIASNTKAAKGVAPVLAMHDLQIPVGLGTDGPASGNTLDLFTQMRFCANFHKNENQDRSVFPAEMIVSMATIEGAKALGLDSVTGSIESGKEADLVVVETDSVNMFPVYDPYSALVYSANSGNVRDVYVAGKQLVKGKKLVSADYREIRNRLAALMDWSAFGTMERIV